MHLIVVERVCFGQKIDFYYNAEDVIPLYLGIAIISLCLGFLGTMLVEVPFSKLEKLLFSSLLKKKDRPVKVVENAGSVLSETSSKSVLSETNPSSRGKGSTLISGDGLEDRLVPERGSIQN